jgi:hypothetical protein
MKDFKNIGFNGKTKIYKLNVVINKQQKPLKI